MSGRRPGVCTQPALDLHALGRILFRLGLAMTSDDLKQLHPHDIPLWLGVETAVWRLALASRVKLHRVVPVPRHLCQQAAGWTFWGSHPCIKISLRRRWEKDKGWSQRFSAHFLIDTICHEVAHLKSGLRADHGPKFFKAFAATILLAEKINIRVDIESSGAILPKG